MIYAFFEFWIFDKWISFKLGKVFSIWTNLQKNEPNYCPSTFQPAHEIVSRFSKIFLPNFYFFILPGRSFQLRSKYLDQKIASMNNCLFKKKSCKGQKISEAILQKKISFFLYVLRRIEDTIIYFRDFLTFSPLKKYFEGRIDEKKIVKTCDELVESKKLSNSAVIWFILLKMGQNWKYLLRFPHLYFLISWS